MHSEALPKPNAHSEAYQYIQENEERRQSKPIRDHFRTYPPRHPTHTGRLPATHSNHVVRVHNTVHHMKPQDYVGLYCLVTVITLASVNYLYRIYF